MKQWKCQGCGHQNPEGTELCQECGRPLKDNKSETLLNMRYEGAARRSQTYNKTMVDRIWNFFSSVKVGVWIIVVILIASGIGTILPQQMYIPGEFQSNPAAYYKDEYGLPGQIYYELGFHNLYGSWWFVLLLGLLATSIIVASIDRYVPLRKSLVNQRPKRHDSFLKRQRLFGMTKTENADESFNKIKQELTKKRYNVKEEDGFLLAEKHRFSRYGPYVVHIGLVLFLLGSMLRYFPGMYLNETMAVPEGEIKRVIGAEHYYLENHKFTFDVYDEGDEQFKEAIESSGMIPKNYQTDATLYEVDKNTLLGAEPELNKVKDYEIRVNEPLKTKDGFAIYQVDYRMNELSKMFLDLTDKETGESFGTVEIDLFDPKEVYDLGNGYAVELLEYFPDYFFNEEKGEPSTKGPTPNNPAFVFRMIGPDNPEGEISFVGIQKNLDSGTNTYKMAFAGIDTRHTTILTVNRDRTLWILGVGATIFMIGVVQGMYWNHRRIWVRKKDDELWISGHTNKNWYGIKKELELMTSRAHVQMPIDQLEAKNKS